MTTATLTDRRVAGAKPGARRYVLKDTRVTGLELRVSPRAGKSWSLVYRRAGDGRRRRATIGPYPRHSLADARQIGRELLARIGRGEDPAGAKQEAKRAATFAQLATAYIEQHAKRKKRSWRDDLAMINRDLLPILGRMKVDTIAKRDVIRAVEIVAQRGALIRANRTLTLARTIFNWGLAEDLVQMNPTLGIRKRAQERPRDRVLNDGEIRAFWVGVSTVPLMTDATRDILRL
ncbi:MAG: tyrosine-type recombinase/integrase, partial [Geminicoccaceae bacterium]